MTIAEKLTLIAQNEQKVYDAGYEKGKSEGVGEVKLQEKTITENGVYTPAEDYDGFSKVTVDVESSGGVGVLQEKTITENGVYTPDEGFDGFSKVAVNVESGASGNLPTLFAPTISFNEGNTTLSISDNQNGAFVEGYNLYANDNYIVTLTNKSEKLSDYITPTETLDLKVKAKGTSFNDSDFSNSVTWIYVEVTSGTIGLAYVIQGTSYYNCAGIGTATETDIEIASEIDGLPVKGFSSSAFKNCTTITSIKMPDSITSVSVSCFEGCSNLKSIKLSNRITALETYCLSKTGLETFKIPNSIKYVNRYAFSACLNLRSLEIGEGISNIRDNAFNVCNNLNYVNIKSLEQWCKITFSGDVSSNPAYYAKGLHVNEVLLEGDIVIPNTAGSLKNAFAENEHITGVTLPNTMTSLGGYSFVSCTNLKTVNFGENSSLTSIGECSFSGCSKLTSVTIPNTVTFIGRLAFQATGLTNLVLPDLLTSVGSGAFNACRNLISIDMGSGSLTTIGSDYACPNLKRVDFSRYTSVPTLSSSDVYSSAKNVQIKVPASLIDEWKSATNWSTYADKIVTEFTNTL